TRVRRTRARRSRSRPPMFSLTPPRSFPHCPRDERPEGDWRHLPGDYELATALAAAVYSRNIEMLGRPAGGGQGSDGIEALRYDDAREAGLCPARSGPR